MDCNIGKSLGAVALGKINECINLLSRHCALSLGIDTAHASAGFNRILEYYKFTILHNICHIRNIAKLHTKTEIRLIRTETLHRLFVCHTLNRKLYIDTDDFLEQLCKQTLIDIDNIIDIHEGKLHIDLCEFRLSVGTQILIAVASCDLEITVVAGAHQKLLVNLW